MGGDEFAAVFQAATPPLIQSLADGLCTAVREQSPATGTNRIPATISIGAAFFDAGTQTHHEALLAADTALHEAKVAGGDRAIVRESRKTPSAVADGHAGRSPPERQAKSRVLRSCGGITPRPRSSRSGCGRRLPRTAVARSFAVGRLMTLYGQISCAASVYRAQGLMSLGTACPWPLLRWSGQGAARAGRPPRWSWCLSVPLGRVVARATRPGIRPVMQSPRREVPGMTALVSCCLSAPAFASWASCPARGFRPSYDRPTVPPEAARTRAGFPYPHA